MGVAASSPESAGAAAAELGADRAFESAEELVRDPDVDVVHICTPNHLHLPLAEAALAAGKHVICEKPLARTLREADEMIATWRSKDLSASRSNRSARALRLSAQYRKNASTLTSP